MLGLLAGTLNGALFGRDVVDFNCRPRQGHQYRAFHDRARSGALPCRSTPSRRRSTATSRELAQFEALPGVDAVRLPGEQRAKRRADRLRNGLPLPTNWWRSSTSWPARLAIAKLGERGCL